MTRLCLHLLNDLINAVYGPVKWTKLSEDREEKAAAEHKKEYV